ncbi:MAG: 3-hydroxyacyl-CoA dehydrogenase family protein [Actinomycetota bacterium]|nr:3-hydroxyacyl-CoA dehydrogenase family protein [Actinomycetota bacterium]
MGRGIAHIALRHGYGVALFDVAAHAARRVAETAAAEGSSLVVAASIAAAVDGADAVIEAVVESRPAKVAVLREMAAAAGPDTLLATNTSTFSIGQLAADAGCAGRLVGMHFFNPAEKMRLVEVVAADGVPAPYLQRAVALAEALGKTPVVVQDSPGFITSRLGLLLGNEAMRLVSSGVAPPDAIDVAMRLGYNHPMGPLELADLVGLDARLNNLNAIYPALNDDRYRPPRILVDLVGAGHLGRKSGRGFYLYDAGGRKAGVAPRTEGSQ